MPELQKDKPDRTVLVAIIGAIAIVAAALIAKMDFSDNSTTPAKVQEEKKSVQRELVKAPENSKSSPAKRQEISQPTKNESPFEVCFENIDDGSQLKNYEIKFEGYNIQVKTDKNGCINIPKEIIHHEKSISSYTIRATLRNESATSESIEIGLSGSSTYKIKIKK